MSVYPVSDRFLPRLAESHTPVTRVQLFLTDGRVVDVPHTGGSVAVDWAQAIRRSCTNERVKLVYEKNYFPLRFLDFF